jgi:hypothetical protein
MNVDDIIIGERYALGASEVVVLAKHHDWVWCAFNDGTVKTFVVANLRPLPPTVVERRQVRVDIGGMFTCTDNTQPPNIATVVGHLLRWSDDTVTYEPVTP